MSCPGCESTATPQTHLQLEDAALAKCRACQLVFVHPMPTREEARALYDAHYFKDPVRGYVDYIADEAVYRAEFRRRLDVLRRKGARGALYDVGCAAGWLLDEARALGFQPSGLEPAPGMAQQAHERTGAPVFAGGIEDVLMQPVHYDVVTIFDVLEHLVAPRDALQTLRLALKPDGLLAVTVPDYGGWWARLSGRHWPFLTPWEHLTYFTRRTLKRLLEDNGFDRVTFHRAGTPLSARTLAAKAPGVARWLPRVNPNRGGSLPMGTLFAVARRPKL